MPKIHLTTFIAAPAERIFDLSRSIDLHKKSMAGSGEQAVAGTTAGLIGADETVTWKAKHFFKTRVMKIRIVAMENPFSYIGEMVSGDLKSYRHEHHFKQIENGTLLIDLVSFEMPYGGLGKLTGQLFVRQYIRRLLEQHNQFIREYAESDKWKFLLNK